MAEQATRVLTNNSSHQSSSDPPTTESISYSVETVCNICEMPYQQDHEQEFTFCCDRPICGHCYEIVLEEGMECPYCGEIVQPKPPKPQYILRFGHRVAAAENSMTPETAMTSSEDEDGSPCTSPEEPPDEPIVTRVQMFLLDSFERLLEDVRVFDEDALTEEQKRAMVRKLEMQLGLRA